LLKLKEKKLERLKLTKIDRFYPSNGPLSRKHYPKHIAFFAAGLDYRERLFLAANRVGKSEGVGGYETTLHLTGLYPDWWPGRRFIRPVEGWVAGQTNQTTRDISQNILMGPINNLGTGLIPGACIGRTVRKAGFPDAFDTIEVKHVSGGMSLLGFKAYDQKRKSFEGTGKDFIWLDEEPPEDVFTECLIRTMTTNGIVILTFTPLMGMSNVVVAFLPTGKLDTPAPGKYVIGATWEDAPHLTQKSKDELWSSIPPFQRDARSKGLPQLGAGAIFPVPEDDYTITDFTIPDHYLRWYALDVGWNWTAALWLAHDRESDIIYVTSVYKRSAAEPSIHATAIKGRGNWIPGVIDPAANARNQKDGTQLMQEYRTLGLNLAPAINAVEAGLYVIWERLSTGRLKVFQSCTQWFEEVRFYRRNEKGQVVKENDHLMDCTRYGVMTPIGIVKPVVTRRRRPEGTTSWMG